MAPERAGAEGAGGPVARVRVPGRETEVFLEQGLRHRLGAVLRERFPSARRLGLVADRHVHHLWPLDLPAEAPDQVLCLAPRGEDAKTRAVLARLQDRLLDLRRDEPVVALGGGALLDVAGFAAATARRGLPWVAVPTTVVGMADASVGGKVAVNHRRGKNLLGTFHPPALVLSDVDYLTTLDERARAAGLAEVYKMARAGDGALLEELRRGPPTSPAVWTSVLSRAVNVKARLVEADERDHGVRRLLNYGHTVGHALERILDAETLHHGEAVAIGMGIAARLARSRGLVGEDFERGQDEDLARLGLPVRLPAAARPDRILDLMELDKKRRAGRPHTFVLPRGETDLAVFEDVTEEEVRGALGGRGDEAAA